MWRRVDAQLEGFFVHDLADGVPQGGFESLGGKVRDQLLGSVWGEVTRKGDRGEPIPHLVQGAQGRT